MERVDLQNIDFERTLCPRGLTVEIEGRAPRVLDLPPMCLGAGIAHAYAIAARVPVVNVAEFLNRVTVLEFDVERKRIKVRIA